MQIYSHKFTKLVIITHFLFTLPYGHLSFYPILLPMEPRETHKIVPLINKVFDKFIHFHNLFSGI